VEAAVEVVLQRSAGEGTLGTGSGVWPSAALGDDAQRAAHGGDARTDAPPPGQ
jgi:hypothetical protein